MFHAVETTVEFDIANSEGNQKIVHCIRSSLNRKIFWVLSPFTPKNLWWACLGYLQPLCTFNSKKQSEFKQFNWLVIESENFNVPLVGA